MSSFSRFFGGRLLGVARGEYGVDFTEGKSAVSFRRALAFYRSQPAQGIDVPWERDLMGSKRGALSSPAAAPAAWAAAAPTLALGSDGLHRLFGEAAGFEPGGGCRLVLEVPVARNLGERLGA